MSNNSIQHNIKVLYVIPGNENNNSMIFSKQQIGSIEKKGLNTKTFYLKSRTSFFTLLHEAKRFKSIIKSFNPDIIHAHYGSMNAFFTSIFANKKNIIITFHGSDLNKTPSDGLFKDIIGRILSQLSAIKAKKIICVNDELKNKILCGGSKTIISPIGININKFRPIDKTIARERLKWNMNEKVILFNANNPKIKRIDIATETINIVKKTIPEARLYILNGYIDPNKIPLIINASDCLLICSDSEGSPMIVKESQSCNLPIVGTNIGDVANRIQNDPASIISKKNAHSLAKSIIQILNSNYTSKGREILINDKLDIENVAETIIKLYKSLIKKSI